MKWGLLGGVALLLAVVSPAVVLSANGVFPLPVSPGLAVCTVADGAFKGPGRITLQSVVPGAINDINAWRGFSVNGSPFFMAPGAVFVFDCDVETLLVAQHADAWALLFEPSPTLGVHTSWLLGLAGLVCGGLISAVLIKTAL